MLASACVCIFLFVFWSAVRNIAMRDRELHAEIASSCTGMDLLKKARQYIEDNFEDADSNSDAEHKDVALSLVCVVLFKFARVCVFVCAAFTLLSLHAI